MPSPVASTHALAADTVQVTDSVVVRSTSDSSAVFVPQYIHGFERSTPLRESDPLKDLQETIIAIPEGFDAAPMPDSPTNNSLLVSIVMVVFLLFAFTFKKEPGFWARFSAAYST